MATTSSIESIAANRYDLFTPSSLQDPFTTYALLRNERPVHWVDKPYSFWLISRYDDVKVALRDEQRFSSVSGANLEKRGENLPPSARQSFETSKRILSGHIQRMDAPTHTAQRQTVMKAFMPLINGVFKRSLEQRVSDLLDKMERSATCDFVSEFAYPLPSQVIFDLLGVPEEHHQLIRAMSDMFPRFIGAVYSADVAMLDHIADQSLLAEDALFGLFEKKRREPGEDLISSLVSGAGASLGLSDRELAVLCIFLLAAGHETTANLLSGSLRYMLSDRRQWEHLLEAPELLPGAVEELLRFVTPVLWVQRVATEDIELHGQIIRKGDNVSLGVGSANHDPDKFADSETLDVTRKNVNSVAFGYGVHTCLGAALARMETEIALSQLLQRFPRIQLETNQFTYHPIHWLRSLKSLPVSIRSRS